MPFFTFIASLIMPIYPSLLAVSAAIKRNSNRLYLFSISLAFATIAFCIDPNPEVDLYRHYIRIDSLKGLPFDIAVSNVFSGYFFFDYFAWIINKLSLPKQFFTASVVFTSYYIMLNIGHKLINTLRDRSTNLIISISFLIFLLNINFISLALGLRSTFAYIIVFYAFYYLITNKQAILFFILSFVAFLIHPSSAIPAIVVFLAYLFPSLSKYGKPIVAIATLLMIFSNFVTPLIEYLDSIARRLPFYKGGVYTDLEGQWGGGFAENASLKGWIATYIIKLAPTYLSIFYILITKPRNNDKLYMAVVLCILYIGIFFGYQTFSSRFNVFSIFIYSFFLIREQLYTNSRFNSNFILLYFVSLLLIWLTNIYSFTDVFLSAKEAFYKPLILILTGI